jgi:hypothetical protein
MKEVAYVPIPGAHLTNEQAQRYGERIASLREQSPQFTVDDVVNDARKSRSPLHDYFEWDDAVAAEMHRHSEALVLIRNIGKLTVTGEGQKSSVRMFWLIQAEDRQEIRTIDEVAARPVDAQAILVSLEADLVGRAARLRTLTEYFTGVKARRISRAASQIETAAGLLATV